MPKDNARLRRIFPDILPFGALDPICHPDENLLQHSAHKVQVPAATQKKEFAMQALINRFLSDIDRLFDEPWVVIWLLDDL
ncbi:MAG: hypothetical protein M0Z99_21765 [Betaproteobacteria bacterium]|nr:hypothetical protein [Betaproteobacteria bacterium]